MSVAISPSDLVLAGAPAPPGYIRAQGRVSCRFARGPDGRTRLAELREAGGYRLKLPRGPACEGVILNTGGGMAGGDRLALSVAVDDGASAVLTSQSAEKIYRSAGGDTVIRAALTLGSGAALAFIPQETILFDGARLSRRLDVEMAADARLLIAETLILGRAAMGETLSAGFLLDQWRVRRAGRLIFAEALRLEAPIDALMRQPCVGAGARTLATILLVGPLAEERLDATRALLQEAACEAGASAWNGFLLIRLLGREAAEVRAAAADVIRHLSGHALPRVWS